MPKHRIRKRNVNFKMFFLCILCRICDDKAWIFFCLHLPPQQCLSISLSRRDKHPHYNINIIFIAENRVRGTTALFPNRMFAKCAHKYYNSINKKVILWEPICVYHHRARGCKRMCFAYNYFYIQYCIKMLIEHASREMLT